MNPIAAMDPPACPVCALLGREVRDLRIAEHLSAHTKAELVEALAFPLRPRPLPHEVGDPPERPSIHTDVGIVVQLRVPERLELKGRLSPTQRRRIHTLAAEGQSAAEIARLVQCSDGAARYHQHRMCTCPS